jgi:two-component system, LytTR family, response regulator
MKIRTVIVDDEPHAIDIISGYLRDFEEVEIVATCPNAIKAFKAIQQDQVDLMFLDIRMPGLSGTDLLRNLNDPPRVIFTTAYREYAVDGFDLDAIDYLMKPVSFDRFLKAMDKVYQSLGSTMAKEVVTAPVINNREIFIYLKVDRKMVKVNVDEILWIESIRDYIKVALKDRTLVTKQKISLLETLLPENKFVRIHRSFIVSIAKVESFNTSIVEIGERQIPIGRIYKADTIQLLRQGSL